MNGYAPQTADSPLSDAAGGVRWQIAPGWHDVLLGPRGFALDEWMRQGRVQVVKHGPHRTVYRVDSPERAFFVKHYRSLPWLAWARNLLRRSASRREYQKALEVARRRVPTIRPVAFGERLVRGVVRDNFFVTEALAGSCPLDRYTNELLPRAERAQQTCLRRKLVVALARLCAAAHRRGIWHDDFHLGNVLVRPETCHGHAGDRRLPELHLVDLPGVRLSGPLNWRRTRQSLVVLAAAGFGRASRTDLWRFWRTYVSNRPELRLADARAAALQIGGGIADQLHRIARSRDKRSMRTNRDFFALSAGGMAGHAVTDLPGDELKRILADPDRLLRRNRHRAVKLSHRSLVVEAELPLAGVPTRVAYKRIRVKNWWKALAAVVRRSRAVEAWFQGHALLQRGISTARPVAVCEPRHGALRWDSYLATQWIEGAENLHLYAWRLAARPAGERRRRTRQAAEALGRLVGRMHAWQTGHRDLKGCNLVVVERTDHVEAYLIDLDGVSVTRRLGNGMRVRNLARLATSLEAHPWISRTDRLRFLRAYLRALSGKESEWKGLWRRVATGSRSVIRRLRRRGRQVV